MQLLAPLTFRDIDDNSDVGWFPGKLDGACAGAEVHPALFPALGDNFELIMGGNLLPLDSPLRSCPCQIAEVRMHQGAPRVVHCHQFFPAIAKKSSRTGVEIEKPVSIDVDCRAGIFRECPEPAFTLANGVLIAAMHDGAGHLLRHEHQDFLLRLPVANVRFISLNGQHAEGHLTKLEGHTHPVARAGAGPALDFASAHQIV